MDLVTPPFVKLPTGESNKRGRRKNTTHVRVNHIAAIFLNALTADYRQEFENFYKGRSDNQGSSPPVTTGLIKPSRKPECLFTRRRGDMKPLNWSGQTTPLSKKIGQRGPTMDERSEGIVSLFFFPRDDTRDSLICMAESRRGL